MRARAPHALLRRNELMVSFDQNWMLYTVRLHQRIQDLRWAIRPHRCCHMVRSQLPSFTVDSQIDFATEASRNAADRIPSKSNPDIVEAFKRPRRPNHHAQRRSSNGRLERRCECVFDNQSLETCIRAGNLCSRNSHFLAHPCCSFNCPRQCVEHGCSWPLHD